MLRLLCFFKLTLHWDAGKRNRARCGQPQHVLTVAPRCENANVQLLTPPPFAPSPDTRTRRRGAPGSYSQGLLFNILKGQLADGVRSDPAGWTEYL